MGPAQWTGRQLAVLDLHAQSGAGAQSLAVGCDYTFVPAGGDHAAALDQARTLARGGDSHVAVLQADDGAFWLTRLMSHGATGSYAGGGHSELPGGSVAHDVRQALGALKSIIRPDGELLEVPAPGLEAVGPRG